VKNGTQTAQNRRTYQSEYKFDFLRQIYEAENSKPSTQNQILSSDCYFSMV